MVVGRKNQKERTDNRRKTFTFLFVFVLVLSLAIVTDIFVQRFIHNRQAVFRTEGGRIQIYRDKTWKDFTVKGVHMDFGRGTRLAAFPGTESGFTKKEYRRWFKHIASMNANAILVQRILSPDFYESFYEFNMLAKKPLFLIHGIRANENYNDLFTDAYDDGLILDISEEIRNTIDVIHGKASVKKSGSGTPEIYNRNIAPYVMGFILGDGADTNFISATNQRNTQVMGFEGNYLYTENASPYEAWLAALGNYTILYEEEKYGGPHRLISWMNRPLPGSEEVSAVDLEHIFVTDKHGAGIFASYAVFPYHPENRRPEYNDFLHELAGGHNMPVLAAEFGVLSSRDRNRAVGISSGIFTEKEQGEALAGIFDGIMNAGFSGGIVYTWYDGAGVEPGYGLVVIGSDSNIKGGFWEQLKYSYTILMDKFSEY